MKTHLYTMIKLLLLISLFAGCVSLETLSLEEGQDTDIATNGQVNKISIFNKENANREVWYSCVKDRPELTLVDSKLQVSLKNAMGDCFGIYFPPMNIGQTPVIKVKVKFSSFKLNNDVDLLIGFTDKNGNKTYYPEKAKMVESKNSFVNFYFDYTKEIIDKEKQVDPEKITSLLIFVNILGVKNISGTMTIEEISLVSK